MKKSVELIRKLLHCCRNDMSYILEKKRDNIEA